MVGVNYRGILGSCGSVFAQNHSPAQRQKVNRAQPRSRQSRRRQGLAAHPIL